MLNGAKRIAIYWIVFVLGIMHHEVVAQNQDPDTDIIVQKDIAYKKSVRVPNDTITLALDIYNRKAISNGKHPAIIFVHGGGFWEGDKQNDVYIKMARAFAVHGYIAISVNYRLKEKEAPYSKIVLDTCLSDVLAAVRWIHQNSERLGIDTSKILICGDSAGGAIVVNLSYDAVSDCYFAGCIDLWGGLPGSRGWDAPIYSAPFTKHTPPTCIIHGTSDQVIPYSTSTHLASELTAKGIYNELHPLQNADHYPVQLAAQFIPVMISFADKTTHLPS
jgi:acetyl esterase/lipase